MVPPVARTQTRGSGCVRIPCASADHVLVNTLVHASSIGYRRLGLTEDSSDERDLAQTALAIETMQALVPVLKDFLPVELTAGFEEQVANLQLAYAKAAKEPGDAEG